MKMNLPFALLGAAALVVAGAQAEDSVLSSREGAEGSDVAAAVESVSSVTTTSRGDPIATSDARETAPARRPTAPRPTSPSSSRPEAGAIVRSIVSDVLQDTSHIVVTIDTAPSYYRYTRATQFMDEGGQVLSADAVKSGINATLHYTVSEGDRVLTRVVVNSALRPLAARGSQALTEVQFDR